MGPTKPIYLVNIDSVRLLPLALPLLLITLGDSLSSLSRLGSSLSRGLGRHRDGWVGTGELLPPARPSFFFRRENGGR